MKFLCLLLLVSAPAWASSWPAFRGGPANDGRSATSLSAASTAEPTSFATHGIVWGTPVIDEDDNVYVGSADKRFYKLRPDGSVAWSYAISDRADALIDSAAVLTPSGKVIVPGGDGNLHALDRTTGTKLWTFKAHRASDSDHQSGVIVNSFEGNVQRGPNGVLYAGSDNGTLYAVDETGKELWNFPTGMMVWSAAAFDQSGAPGSPRWMAFGSLDHHLYLLDPTTGAALDSFDAGSEVKASPATDGAGNLYFGTASGAFLKLEVRETSHGWKLKKIWSHDFGGELYSSPALTTDGAVFGSLDGHVYAIGLDGKSRWSYATHSPVASSPVVSADGLVVLGAKNGKLYALDVREGSRVWSYRTSTALFKSNVDSSPTLRGDGVIVAGSYNGRVHFIPGGFCLAHRGDSRCEFGGGEDLPDLGAPAGADDAVMRVLRRDGNFSLEVAGLGRYEPVSLKLVAFEHGHLIDRAAISATGLSVSIEPKTPFKAYISSDGGTLNILPDAERSPGGFPAGTRYHVVVNGHYYHSTSWLADRFKWLGLKSFHGEAVFETSPDTDESLPLPKHWALSSLYLRQPQALDTYIPAALDGQAFIAMPFATNPSTGRFLLLMQPALPAEPSPLPLLEPARAFVLEGAKTGHDLRAVGAMKVSAMGGTIPFKNVVVSGTLDSSGDFTAADFFTVSSCLDMKGNGQSYSFPYSLLALACDYKLRLIGLGAFVGRRLDLTGAQPAPAITSASWTDSTARTLKVDLRLGGLSSTDRHLVSIVRFAPDATRISGVAFAVTPDECAAVSACQLAVGMQPGSVSPSADDLVEVFVDQADAGALPTSTIARPRSGD